MHLKLSDNEGCSRNSICTFCLAQVKKKVKMSHKSQEEQNNIWPGEYNYNYYQYTNLIQAGQQ